MEFRGSMSVKKDQLKILFEASNPYYKIEKIYVKDVKGETHDFEELVLEVRYEFPATPEFKP